MKRIATIFVWSIAACLSCVAAVMGVREYQYAFSDPVIPHLTYDDSGPVADGNGNATSVAVVEVFASVDGTHWTKAFDVTNPDHNGEMWSLPSGAQYRAEVTAWASGTIKYRIVGNTFQAWAE